MKENRTLRQRKDEFEDRGYIIVKGAIEEQYFQDIERSFLAFLRKYSSERFAGFTAGNLMEDQNFHDAYLDLKKKSPRLAGAVYDSIQCAYPLIKLSISPSIVAAISELAGVPTTEISNFNHGLRMDIPRDEKNLSPWHQDTFNDEGYHDYKAGITAWMPLHTVDSHNGSLWVCPQSHQERVARKVKERPDPTASLEYFFPNDYLNKFERISVEMNRGDLLLLSMNLVHSSGENQSSRVRFTVQTRYYPFVEDNFVAGKPIYKSSVL